MLGAIAGDIIGSVYEFDNSKPEFNFQLFREDSFFTDDTVLTAALADSILSGTPYRSKLIEYYHSYPNRGYGSMFHQWAQSEIPKPYNSWGNGSAMRVSPVGWAFDDIETVLEKSKQSAEITHNHPEGIKGAQATASAIFLARTGASKPEIKEYIEYTFAYDLDLDMKELRNYYKFNESCQDTVPQAIYTFLQSANFEDSLRKAIYIGGDSDTLACINGSIAEAYYGPIDDEIKKQVFSRLDERLTSIVEKFYKTFINH